MITEIYNIPGNDLGQISSWISAQSLSVYYLFCESVGDEVKVHFDTVLPSVDKQNLDDYFLNYEQDTFKLEIALTDQRNDDGFNLYKKIFAHISDNEPIGSIDSFISISDKLHKLRNFLKDGNFETAVRYMELEVRPISVETFPQGYETYREWVREICKKYNSSISDSILDDIEQAPVGAV